MRGLLLAAALALPISVAAAQAPAPVPVPLNPQERAAILEMCESAVWADRRKFDGFCAYLREKFTAAEAAKIAADKAVADPPAQPKEKP